MHDVLTKKEMWRYDGLSEDKLDIAYRKPEATTPINIDSDESDNRLLRSHSPQEARNNKPARKAPDAKGIVE